MNFAAAERIVNAVLYEGYVLYPYRPSSIKNRQRWTFGGVYPTGSSAGAAAMETQCLLAGDAAGTLEARIRFLQPMSREITRRSSQPCKKDEAEYRSVPVLDCDGRRYYAWEEAVEREIRLPPSTLARLSAGVPPHAFEFAGAQTVEPIVGNDGAERGRVVRTLAPVCGCVGIELEELERGAYRLVLRVENTSAAPPGTLNDGAAQAFMSTHAILGIEGGRFVSTIDPPPHLAQAARACSNQSAWPVLAGAQGSTDTLLCSPIILYDYPQIAPESPGDLFDGTEIDEILTLRILTMTDAEKQEMIANDERARALLERTEALTLQQMQQLHGVMRSPNGRADEVRDAGMRPPRLAALNHDGRSLVIGARVRLNPRHGADIIDLALAGQTAVIEALEVDFDNRVHVAVTVDADPGRDLGLDRMPGHRFFFSPEEIEIVAGAEACP